MISKEKYMRIHELSELGVSGRKIALSVGLANQTVLAYLKMDEAEFESKQEKYRNTNKGFETYRQAIVEIISKYPEAKPSVIRNRLQMMYDDFKVDSNVHGFYQYINIVSIAIGGAKSK